MIQQHIDVRVKVKLFPSGKEADVYQITSYPVSMRLLFNQFVRFVVQVAGNSGDSAFELETSSVEVFEK